MSSFNISFISCCLLLGLSACKKQEADKVAPEVFMISPVPGMVHSYASYPEIHLEFTVKDASFINQISTSLSDSSSKKYYDNTLMPRVKLFPFHVHIPMNQPVKEMSMRFSLTVSDVAGNTVDTNIYFVYKP